VLVHCSLRRVGPVVGGPATVLTALREVLGPDGTVVVPTQTADNSTTSPSFRAATRGLDAAQIAEYEAALPGFDSTRTPSQRMGAFAEHIRCQPGSVRSGHPQTSFTALGPRAGALMAIHDLDCHLGERSPLAALYTANANVLLLGVGYEVCTALHLAEYRLPWPAPVRPYRCYVRAGERRERLDFMAADLVDYDFPELGADLDRQSFVTSGRVGNALATVMPVRAAVDFAVRWLTGHAPGERPVFGGMAPLPWEHAARLESGESRTWTTSS
jgi:Aminoglycoside N3''-acetyltransferase